MRCAASIILALSIAVMISTATSADSWTVDDQFTGFTATGRWNTSVIWSAYDDTFHYTAAVSPNTWNTPTARWIFPGDAAPAGFYRVEIWLPTGAGKTQQAVYTVTDDYGTTEVVLDQSTNWGWTALSSRIFTFTARMPTEGVTLSAATTDADGSVVVIADAVRFTAVPEPSAVLALACGIGSIGFVYRRRIC